MGSNVRAFNLALDKFGRKAVPELAQKRHQAVALEGLKGVVEMSPVDKGRFKGNWQLSHGDPATGEVDRTDTSAHGTAEGSATFAAESQKIDAAKPFDVTWIVNNVPYAQRLENGHSQSQAPGGMVSVTATRLRSMGRSNRL